MPNPVGRPRKVQPEVVEAGPCIICKRMTTETAEWHNPTVIVFLHNYDCEGPRP